MFQENEIEHQFHEAAAYAISELSCTTNSEKLHIYALFKQAEKGDCPSKARRPNVFQMRERAKFDAWSELRGKTSIDAMKEYIELVDRLKNQNENQL